MSKLIHIIGEDHPENLLGLAINRIDDNLPTEAQLREWDLSDLISALSSYQRVMDKYFYRTEEKGKRYLNGSREIKFYETTERIFWEDLFRAVNEIYSLNPREIEKAMKELEISRKISSHKKDIIKEILPDTIYHEGIRTRGGHHLENGLHSTIPIEAKNIGAKLIYLDDGFEPYADPDLDRWGSQKGREQHWAERVVTNLPRKIGLLFVGDDHL